MPNCPRCGEMNEERATFCLRCGSPMADRLAKAVASPATYLQTRFDRTFKGAGPFIKSFLALIFLLLVLEVSRALSSDSAFAEGFADFLSDNLFVFFIIVLISFYSGFFSRTYPRESSVVSPLVVAVVVTFSWWVVANVFDLLGRSEGISELTTMADLLFSILYIIFLLIVLLGYIRVVMKAGKPGPFERYPTSPPVSPPPAGDSYSVPQPYQPVNRLGRSTRDKVIFGVCGGMAEYFASDPLVIRVLWVIGTILSGGVFIIAYLILALALPKNP